MQIRLPFLPAIMALILPMPAWTGTPPQTRPAAQIESLLDRDPGPTTPIEADLRQFYAKRDFAPAWDAASEAQLASVLAAAPAQGLPGSFAMPDAQATGAGAARDIALSRVALAYATALARGRVEPERIEADWAITAPAFDSAAGLDAALRHGLAVWYASLAPHHQAYQRLVAALARYRAMTSWEQIPRGAPLRLGMTDLRVAALRKRLEAEGDLVPRRPPSSAPEMADAGPIERVASISGEAPAVSAGPDFYFDETVEAAVRRFQSRYGIAVDGAVGPRTLAAMNMPLRVRIEQIALNLERWRALPHDLGASYMLVNVPAETLDVVESHVPVITMKVVVGDVDHPTPVVRTAMVALTINPAWTIPASIVTNEIEPKAKRDHTYLVKNEILFTPGRGWQQLPGPRNPLGQLKFETPNQFDVYLHDTPSRMAFDRFFRAQSHGCVRLENAAELAGFVLSDMGWNEQQIAQAAADGSTRRIDLKHSWRVWLLYATSFVDEDGTVEFRDDLYGRDARLRDALDAARVTGHRAKL